MVNFLLLLSMVLNGVTLFCIVILYLRQNRLIQVEKKQEQLLKEMEEVISTYLIEMTEENEAFIKKVRELVSTKDVAVNSYSNSTKEKPIQPTQESEPNKDKSESTLLRKGTVFQAVQAYKNVKKVDESPTKEVEPVTLNIEKTVESKPMHSENVDQIDTSSKDLYTQSFYYQVLLLQKQGLSTEDIARRLDKGKTEIELLLKLRQNNKE